MNISMKICVFLFLFCSIQSIGQIERNVSISNLLELAKMKNKGAFIKVYSANCHYCKALEPILETKEVSDFYNKNFVSYYMEFQEITDNERQFLQSKNIKISGVPTLLFFDKEGNIQYQDNPPATVEDVIKTAKDALNPKHQFKTIEKKYYEGDKSINVLYAMSQWAHMLGRDTLLDTIANDLYNTFLKRDSLFTKKSFLVFKRCVFDIDNGLYDYWSKKNDSIELKSLNLTPEDINMASKRVVNRMLDPDKKNQLNLARVEKMKKEIVKTGVSDQPNNILWEDEIRELLKLNRNEDALKLAESMLIKQEFNPTLSNSFMIYYIHNFPKKNYELLKQWIKKIELNSKTNFDKFAVKSMNETLKYKENEP